MKRLLGLMGFMLIVLAACTDGNVTSEVVINFDAQGGDAVDSITASRDSETVNLPTPTREGYRFLGWTLANDVDTDFSVAALEGVESLTLVARWEAVDEDDEELYYTVTFVTHVNDVVITQTVQEGSVIDVPSAVDNEGYAFGGWYKDEAFTQVFDLDEGITNDLTVYAQWKERFTVRFMVDGTLYNSLEVTEGNEVTVPAMAPTLEGFTFDTWYLDDAFDTAAAPSFVVTEDTDIYARFAVDSFTLQFDMGVAETIDALVLDFGESISLPNAPEVDGYIFKGWYTDATFETAFDLETMPAEGVMLYAQYASLVTVTYRLDDETVYLVQELAEGEAVSLPSAPEVDGYTFIGWRFMDDAFEEGDMVHHTMEVMALFEAEVYTVIFVTNAGSSLTHQTYEVNDAFDFEETTREGYIFAGWYLNDSFTEALTFDVMPAQHVTLYAKWITESDSHSVADIINIQPETARIDSMLVVYTQTFMVDGEPLTVSFLNDGSYTIAVVSDLGLVKGDYVSFEAVMQYVETMPIVVDVIGDVTVEGTSTSVPNMTQEVDLRTFMDYDLLNPWTVGVQFIVEGFVMTEGTPTLIDLTHDEIKFVPVINLEESDFALLEHSVIRGGFIVLPPLQSPFTMALYDATIEPLSAIALSDDEKLEYLGNLLSAILENEQFSPGNEFMIPETDPFFGATIDLSVDPDFAAYYDGVEGEFLWTDELVFVPFNGTISMGETTRTINLTVRLAPPLVYALDMIRENHLVYANIRGVVLHVDSNTIILQDSTALIVLRNSLHQDVVAGDEIIVNVSFDFETTILTGDAWWIEYVVDTGKSTEIESELYCWGRSETTCNATDLAFAGDVDGILMDLGEDAYTRFGLLTPEGLIYLHTNDALDDATAYMALVGDFVSVTGVIGNMREEDGLMTIDLYGFDNMLTEAISRDATVSDYFEIAEHRAALQFPDVTRPMMAYRLASEVIGDVHVSYDFTSTMINYNYDAQTNTVVFEEEGTAYVTVTLTKEDETQSFLVELNVEDYTVTHISEAVVGETYTFEVTIDTIIGMSNYYIARDDTGVFTLDPNDLEMWLELGDTLLVTGTVEENYGVYFLVDAHVELFRDATFLELDPTLYTIDELKALPEPYEGMMLVEVNGYVRYGQNSMAIYEDAESGQFFDLFIAAPYDSVLFGIDGAHEISVMGYFVRNEMGENVIVYVSHTYND